MSDASKVQALPVDNPNSNDVLESLRNFLDPNIFSQLEERVALGVRKYGTRLRTHNGRDALLDCRQELLDGCMYSRQAMLEGTDNGQLLQTFISALTALESSKQHRPTRKVKSLYIIGSLRNPNVPIIASKLRIDGFDVFDDWYSGGPEADDKWQEYEKARGRGYAEALAGVHAQNVFQLDKYHIDSRDAVVMVAPAGKSGHLELGYARGTGKPGFIYMEKEPERYDCMYGFATAVVFSYEDLLAALKRQRS